MNSYSELFKSICRLCLEFKNSEKMISLIDNSMIDGLSSYAKAVLTFANIAIQKQDEYPTFMCLNCLGLLKTAIYFKFKCESSDNILKYIANTLSSEKHVLREKVVEYVMYKLYLPDELQKTSITVCKSKKLKQNVESYRDNDENIFQNDISDDNLFDNISNHNSEENSNNLESKCVLDKMESMFGKKRPISPEELVKQPVKRRKLRMPRKYREKQKKLLLKNKKSLANGTLICTLCNKVLANQLTYEHHMQRHTGCRYICEHCGKGFPVMVELEIHQVARHGTGPSLQCPQCSFKARRKFDMVEHERIHSGERPYACDKCGLTFRRRGIWKKHLIYHTEKRVQCPHCPKKFFQRGEMLAHVNNIHDRMYVYLCSKCGVTYAKTATVRRHMTERHGIPREKQGKIIRINKASSYSEQ